MRKLIILLPAIAILFSYCKQNSATVANGASADSIAVTLARNKKVALASDEAFNAKNIDAIYKDCAPGFVDYGNGATAPVSNIDSLKYYMTNFLAAFPDFKVQNLHAVAQGDTVIVTGQWSGTFKKDFMGMKPTYKAFNATDADIFTFNKDGKITSHRSIQSEATYFSQLGIPIPKSK